MKLSKIDKIKLIVVIVVVSAFFIGSVVLNVAKFYNCF